MKFPLVLDFAADGIPVAVACRVLGFSKQAFYSWKAAPVTDRDWTDAHLINAAVDVHRDDPAFGYRFIADELEHQGFSAGENRVARLCSSQRIWSVFAKKRGLTVDGEIRLRVRREPVVREVEAIEARGCGGLDALRCELDRGRGGTMTIHGDEAGRQHAGQDQADR